MIKVQIVIAILSLFLIIITFELIRNNKLREEYSILWFLTAIVVLMFSIMPDFFLSKILIKITGMYYISSIFFVAFLFLILILLHFSVVISTLTDKNRDLAQEYALLENKLREIENKFIAIKNLYENNKYHKNVITHDY